MAKNAKFQSTPSARRATAAGLYVLEQPFKFQSTPSARRATQSRSQRRSTCSYFNPRPPRGERLLGSAEAAQQVMISIHALREESDVEAHNSQVSAKIFQSTPSARRATL